MASILPVCIDAMCCSKEVSRPYFLLSIKRAIWHKQHNLPKTIFLFARLPHEAHSFLFRQHIFVSIAFSVSPGERAGCLMAQHKLLIVARKTLTLTRTKNHEIADNCLPGPSFESARIHETEQNCFTPWQYHGTGVRKKDFQIFDWTFNQVLVPSPPNSRARFL